MKFPPITTRAIIDLAGDAALGYGTAKLGASVLAATGVSLGAPVMTFATGGALVCLVQSALTSALNAPHARVERRSHACDVEPKTTLDKLAASVVGTAALSGIYIGAGHGLRSGIVMGAAVALGNAIFFAGAGALGALMVVGSGAMMLALFMSHPAYCGDLLRRRA